MKRLSVLPDVFVRRSDGLLITISLSPQLIESRQTRLTEGPKVVSGQANLKWQRIWEGQYFFELEFLLFNCENSMEAQHKVVAKWSAYHCPSLTRRLIVQAYLVVVNATKTRAYFVLRCARRVAMRMLPEWYFAKKGQFESARLAEDQFHRLQASLQQTS